MDEEKELARGNPAVGIIIASIFFAIALVVQAGISGISVGIMKALAGDWLAIVASLLQLILGIILAIGAMYLALNILDRRTKGNHPVRWYRDHLCTAVIFFLCFERASGNPTDSMQP